MREILDVTHECPSGRRTSTSYWVALISISIVRVAARHERNDLWLLDPDG